MSELSKRFNWFKLENYINVREFSLNEWHKVISDRLIMSHLLVAPDSIYINCTPEEITVRRMEIMKYWEIIRTHGTTANAFKNYHEEDEESANFFNKFNSIIHRENNLTGSIRNFTQYDAILDIFERENTDELLQDFKQYQADRVNWYFNYKNDGDFATLINRESFKKKYGAPLSYEDFAVIGISLSASDEQLKDNFSLWLATQRALEFKSGTMRVTQKDFDSWSNSKLLPYFDLLIISRMDGFRISNHLIGDLLFPDEVDVDVAERIRKVVRKKANQVFTEENLAILGAQLEEI